MSFGTCTDFLTFKAAGCPRAAAKPTGSGQHTLPLLVKTHHATHLTAMSLSGTNACRVPELVALLDPARSFPAAFFAADAGLLGALQQLGMRSALSVQALLDSAHYIERLGATDPAEATER